MQKRININSKVLAIMKSLLFAYILTGGFLLLLALLLYRFQLKESVVSVGIIVIYVIATFFAGFLMGKKMETRKFLWGLLIGGGYFFILLLVSLAVNHSLKDVSTHFATSFFLCAGSGMLGGMLS